MAACERWRAAGLQRILSKLANMLEIQLPQGYWQHAVCFAALACAADGRWSWCGVVTMPLCVPPCGGTLFQRVFFFSVVGTLTWCSSLGGVSKKNAPVNGRVCVRVRTCAGCVRACVCCTRVYVRT